MKRIIITLAISSLLFIPLFSQNVSIPDANFLVALIEAGVDTDEDGEISIEEAEAVTAIGVNEKDISDLTGIEAFVNLEDLYCKGNELTSLDVSHSTVLRLLDCSDNQLTNLDLSNNITLGVLLCGDNQFSGLDISNNTGLGAYSCIAYAFGMYDCTELGLQNMPTLKRVCVSESFNVAIRGCSGRYQPVDSVCVDTTGSPNVFFTTDCDPDIVYIPDELFFSALIKDGVDTDEDGQISYAEAEGVTELDVESKNPPIHVIEDLTGIEAFVNLKSLDCGNNLLSSLDVSKNTLLEYLQCGSNRISSLDMSNNTFLTNLYCGGNRIIDLDVSNNTMLESLCCANNQLTNLDISNNDQLEALYFAFMPGLNGVCVWESFDPETIDIDTTDSPNIYFDNTCGVGNTGTFISNYKTSELSIYPNPTSNLLTIETDNPDCYSLEIHSLNGQLIYKEEMEGSSHQIDMTPFSKGIYFITVRSDAWVRTEKVVRY